MGFESITQQGSTFWVEFPVGEGPTQTDLTSELKSSRSGGGNANAGDLSILYIDDHTDGLKLFHVALGASAHIQVLTATTPAIGLGIADTHRPSLILLDLNPPKMDGYELHCQLMTQPWAEKIPVVAVTTQAITADRIKAAASGFSESLTKPLHIPDSLKTVEKVGRDGGV